MVDTVKYLQMDGNIGTFKSGMASNCPECGIPYVGFNVPWAAFGRFHDMDSPFSNFPLLFAWCPP